MDQIAVSFCINSFHVRFSVLAAVVTKLPSSGIQHRLVWICTDVSKKYPRKHAGVLHG
jgi:hypothetical protein